MRLIDADAFIKQYCEDCGYGCILSNKCCDTVEDLLNFPSALSVSCYEEGKILRVTLPKEKKIMTYNGEEIDFDYAAEDMHE